MRLPRYFCVLATTALLTVASAARAQEAHVVYQNSLVSALLQGGYDGPTTIGDLRQHGDFGLGTVNALDGELLAFGGAFYQVRSDGAVHTLPNDAKTPFAVMVAFQPTLTTKLPAIASFAALGKAIDAVVPPTAMAAVRIHGTFPVIETRSVPRQSPPYRPLAKVVEEQTLFHLTNVTGTLVGFRTPDYLRGIGVVGYHFHFLNDEKTAGGHVIEIRTDAPMTVDIDVATRLSLDLPASSNERLGEDMSEQLRKVEHPTDQK